MQFDADDFLLAACGIAPLPVTSGGFRRWVSWTAGRGSRHTRHRGQDHRRSLPAYQLRDIGPTRDDAWRAARARPRFPLSAKCLMVW